MAQLSSDADYPTSPKNVDRELDAAGRKVTHIIGLLSWLQNFQLKLQNSADITSQPVVFTEFSSILEATLKCICANHEKIKVSQDALGFLTRIVENAEENIQLEITEMKTILKQRDKRILHLEQKLAMQEAQICQLLIHPHKSEQDAATNGIMIWCIDNYRQRKQDAKSSGPSSFYSDDFHSDPCGYRMCARIYLNGDGVGKASHLSIFFAIKKGKYDDILKWPFGLRVQFNLLNQNGGEHISDAFRPDANSSSFKKPTRDMNIASGCPMFTSQQVVETKAYLKNDKIWIKVTVGQ